MKKVIQSLLLGGIVLLSACQKDDAIVTEPSDLVEKTVSNVLYGSNALQVFDYYLPAGRSAANTKVMIMIHGGGWTEGDKSDFTPFVDTLKHLLPHYAVFNINYRLANGSAKSNLFPTQELDVNSAVDFIYSKRAEYNISDKFVLLGASAGGHLALLQGYKQQTPKIKAVVNFFGPSDFVKFYTDPPSAFVPLDSIAKILQGTPTTNPQIYYSSSPINYISAQSPATISLQGGVDPLVNPQQQVVLKSKLDAAGVKNEYVFYPTESHGWVGPNLDNSFARIKAFLTANVK